MIYCAVIAALNAAVVWFMIRDMRREGEEVEPLELVMSALFGIIMIPFILVQLWDERPQKKRE